MPTYRQEDFIRRAVESLLAQTLERWELVIVDDGPGEATRAALEPYAGESRVSVRAGEQRGLGAALNHGLDFARADLVAYLPSDDVVFSDHLLSLAEALSSAPSAVAAVAGVRHHGVRTSTGQIDGYPLQLVQVMHRRTDDRWVERREFTSDDLDRMFWSKLRTHGPFVTTDRITCEWVDHPRQRHKLIQERPGGGLNPYRSHYQAGEPLVFEPSVGNRIDERALYGAVQAPKRRRRSPDSLKILLVGELAYNPDRILALADRGHLLYGLWTPTPWSFNSIGPLPFGEVKDLPREDWRRAMKRVRPDIIYALLNWQAVEFAHEVLCERRRIPFVWHFKESPFICIENGTWPKLLELYREADGCIYSSAEAQAWFWSADPTLRTAPSLVVDGDLPRAARLRASLSPRLSDDDGAVHTVVPGRPVGMDLALVAQLARHGIHLHFYGAFQGPGLEWLEQARSIAEPLVHEHPLVGPERWVEEFSRYDAGWLHVFRSDNRGDPRRATWDDINVPARLGTLLAAGVPVVQVDNRGSAVASQSLARDADVGVFFEEVDDLATQLTDPALMHRLRTNAEEHRVRFTFDYHADGLIDFFRTVIAGRPA